MMLLAILSAFKQDGEASTDRSVRRKGYVLCVVLILGLALSLRYFKLGEWSLWDDEETTIYFALRPERPFPSFFPIFFLALHGFFRLAGASVEAGRIFSAAIGIGSIVLTYACFRKLFSGPVLLVAALLLTINLGHLFWSQSIRYYTLVLIFQLLSMYWFLDGFERGRSRALLLSNLAFVCALLTHFSAVLLAPVYVGYLALVLCRRESGGGYDRKHYLLFGLPLLMILGVFAGRFLQAQRMLSGWGTYAAAQDPVHILVTVVAYFGVPVICLGFAAPFVALQVPKRVMLFLLTASGLPMLELAVIARLNLTSVAWYYAFFSLLTFIALAAVCLVSLYQRHRLTSALLGSATVLYYACFLVAYYTTMHGDRPRWQEATAFLRQEAGVTAAKDAPEVFATVPGVVAHYLGVDPAQTMGHPRVQGLTEHPPAHEVVGERWYVVEARCLSSEYISWFGDRCTLERRFDAHTGPVDRSVRVYHCAPRSLVSGWQRPVN